jgi:hypothetical protein
MKFGEVDSYDQRHTMVVVGCKIELICENPNWVRSCFCFMVATLLDHHLNSSKNLQGCALPKLFTLMLSWMRCKELDLFGLKIS